MSETAKTLSDRARELPPADRLRVVDDILGSLDETDGALDRLWAREQKIGWPHGGAAKSLMCRWKTCCASSMEREHPPA